MAGRALSQTVRVDAWLWSIRLFPTRSAATAACKAGHVRVNGSSAKPAHLVRVADTIRARTIAAERTVIAVALVEKRTSAAKSSGGKPSRDMPVSTCNTAGSFRPRAAASATFGGAACALRLLGLRRARSTTACSSAAT